MKHKKVLYLIYNLEMQDLEHQYTRMESEYQKKMSNIHRIISQKLC